MNKLRHIEKQRGTHTKTRFVLKPQSRDGVQSILIPYISIYANVNADHTNVEEMWKVITPQNGKNIEKWERVTDRETVEAMLLRWQQLHIYRQTRHHYEQKNGKQNSATKNSNNK